MDCAILRPMESDGDHFLAYYLTQEDTPAELFKDSRFLDDTNNPVRSFSFFSFLAFTLFSWCYCDTHCTYDHQTIPFFWVRDYETVKIEQDVPNEFLLVLDNGDLPPTRGVDGSTLERRAKGAYYKNLERKITLKKKRVNVRALLKHLLC